MRATDVIREIEGLPDAERERVFNFVLRALRPTWAVPKPPGYFESCYTPEEVEVSNWLADQGPKVVVP
jgi:hypothetical protein